MPLARKNFLFSDTTRGVEASATVFSIIETAIANEVDPYEYLVHIFKSLPDIGFRSQTEILDSYMPWSKALPEACRMKKKKTKVLEGADIIENTKH